MALRGTPVLQNQRLSILPAEDDEDDAAAARGVLSEITDFCSYVDWVSTYEAAAERICDNQHNVYLFDYSLGAESGLDLLNLVDGSEPADGTRHGI